MDAESIEVHEEQEKKVTLSYLTYTFGVGLTSIALVVYWGVTGFSFLISIALGGLIQVFFRTTKRMWSNKLNPNIQDSRNPLLVGIIETLPTAKVFMSLYLTMVAVSSLWYGVGLFFGWLFS
jgi:uncharacterized membrane protein YjjP (DUF1212 family)